MSAVRWKSLSRLLPRAASRASSRCTRCGRAYFSALLAMPSPIAHALKTACTPRSCAYGVPLAALPVAQSVAGSLATALTLATPSPALERRLRESARPRLGAASLPGHTSAGARENKSLLVLTTFFLVRKGSMRASMRSTAFLHNIELHELPRRTAAAVASD